VTTAHPRKSLAAFLDEDDNDLDTFFIIAESIDGLDLVRVHTGIEPILDWQH